MYLLLIIVISFDELQVMSMGPTELADALMDPMMMAMGGMLGNQPITAAPAIQFSQSRQLPPFSLANHSSSRHSVRPITEAPAISTSQSQQLPPFISANQSAPIHFYPTNQSTSHNATQRKELLPWLAKKLVYYPNFIFQFKCSAS